MKYYVRVGERNLGPLSLDELRQRGLSPDEYVWCEGMADWRRAAEVAELATVASHASRGMGPPAFGAAPPAGAKGSPYASPADYMDYRDAGRVPGPKHSMLGIVSCVMGVVMAVATIVVFVATMALFDPKADPEKLQREPIVAVGSMLFCGSPLVFLLGLVLGLVGWFQPDRLKLFSITGSIINGICLLGVLGLIVLGVVAAALMAR